MRITVLVKTGSRHNRVQQIDESTFHIHVSVPPVEGKANARVIELLAEFFDKPKSSFRFVRGLKSKEKVLDVLI